MKEDILHKQINQYLFFYQRNNKNLLFYTYMPFGEKRTLITGSLLKSKGTKKGVPDFLLIFKDKTNKNQSILIWLECKVGNNKQTPEQIDFENMIKQFNNQFYFLVKSVEDLQDILNFNKC